MPQNKRTMSSRFLSSFFSFNIFLFEFVEEGLFISVVDFRSVDQSNGSSNSSEGVSEFMIRVKRIPASEERTLI